MPYISDHWRAMNIRHHEKHPAWGSSSKNLVAPIDQIIRDNRFASVLDYGCGKGFLKEGLGYGFIDEYDPAIVGKDSVPTGVYELVACLDVLEHVEPDCLDDVLQHLCDICSNTVFMTISTRMAHRQMPDGRNPHLIIENFQWWLARIAGVFDFHDLTWWPSNPDEITVVVAVNHAK